MAYDNFTLEADIYRNMYNKYGIRKLSGVYSPSVHLLSTLSLPRSSVYHHLSMNEESIGPRPDDPEIANYDQRMLIEHIAGIETPLGKPKMARGNPIRDAIAEYRRKYRKIRPLNNYEKSVEEESSLLIVNYDLLPNLYVYPASRFSGYYRWHNVMNHFFKELDQRMHGNARHHYISVDLPQRLPSRRVFLRAEGDYQSLSPQVLSLVSRPKYMMLIEMWKWMGVNRNDSIMGQISESNYLKLNIIIKDQGHWSLVNLGRLQDITGEYNDLDDKMGGSIGSASMQKDFLRLLGGIVSNRTEGSDEEEPEEEVSSKNKTTGTVITKHKETPKVDKEDPVKPDDGSDEIEESADEEAENIEELDVLLDEMDEADGLRATTTSSMDYPSDVLKRKYEDLAELGHLTAAEYKRLERLSEKTNNIKNPYGEGTLGEYSVIDKSLTEIKDSDRKTMEFKDSSIESSMKEASLDVSDKRYIKEILNRDVANAVLDIQRAGVIVEDYRVEEVDIIGSRYHEVSIKVSPIDGASSTLRFKYPIVDEYGIFESGGVKYRMKKQRGDLPIRKVSHNKVALTTYYAKVFVERSERSVVNYPRWLIRQISSIALDDNDNRVTGSNYRTVAHHEDPVPRIYNLLGNYWSSITLVGKYQLSFEYNKRNEGVPDSQVKEIEKNGYLICGRKKSKKTDLVVIDETNHFYLVSDKDVSPIGDIEEILELDTTKAPVEIAEFRLFSKNVPVGIALGYYYGLNVLINILGVKPRRVAKGARLNMESHEYAIRFGNETLVLSRKDRVATIILAGFNRYHKEIAHRDIDSFNNSDVYVNLMEEQGFRVGFIREMDLAMDMFVDPISREILKDMKEPTSLDKLLIRSCELLLTDWHPRENDRLYQRDKGYERISGHVYAELVGSVRKYRSRPIGKVAKMEMNPQSVWMEIVAKDSSKAPVEESNPIRDIKEREDATMSGTGGRTDRSMVKRTRSVTKSDMGLTSEATTDSGSTGVNFSLPPNPNHVSVRGIGKKYDPKDHRTSSMISSSFLMAPNADHDDSKRINFISIQHSHGVEASGGEPSPIATGYDKVVAHRTSGLFSAVADGDGVVTDLKEGRYIMVDYGDGDVRKYPLVKEYGKVSGSVVPHEKTTTFNVGDKVSKGDVIYYHKGFFAPDPLDPGQVLWKMGVISRTAFIERPNTFEDSCEISSSLADKFVTPMSHVKDIFVTFDMGIRDLVSIGDEVGSETILCMLEDAVVRKNDLFDEDSIQTLMNIGSNAPRAEHEGRVERIEVFYHGDVEDMSEDLSRLVSKYDKAMMQRMKDQGQRPKTGRVDDTLKFGADPLSLDTAVIRVYITEDLTAGEGDKGVFGNQLKTVISNILIGRNQSEDGQDIDALFSYKSVANRMVESAKIMGMATSLLKTMSKIVHDFHNEK